MAVSKNNSNTTAIILVGRKSQYIAGIGIVRYGRELNVSATHAKKLCAAKNRATGDYLFVTKEEFESRMEREALSRSGSNLDLGLVEKGTPKGGAVEIEEALNDTSHTRITQAACERSQSREHRQQVWQVT